MIIKEKENNELIICFDNSKVYDDRFLLFCQNKELFIKIIRSLYNPITKYGFSYQPEDKTKLDKFYYSWYKDIVSNGINRGHLYSFVDEFKKMFDEVCKNHNTTNKYFEDINKAFEYVKEIK